MTFLQAEISIPLWVLLGVIVIAVSFAQIWTTRKVKPTCADEEEGEAKSSSSFKQHGLKDAPFKMLLCVNTTLGMGKGKIAAQCGHATLGAYKLSTKYNKSGLQWWETTGCAKIAVKVSEEEMQEIEETAHAQGLVSYVVRDAGRTQIAAGSRTVLAIGPSPVHEMKFTNHLKLL